MVIPSSRVCAMKLYSEDDENLVLRNNEKIEWLAGGSLENLVYKLYDEAGREVPLTAEIASKIKVAVPETFLPQIQCCLNNTNYVVSRLVADACSFPL